MTGQWLWLLLVALVRVSIEQCTVEEFDVLDTVLNSETSEVTHNVSIMEVIYNCLATSHVIGTYSSMSVSVLYNRSDNPHKLRNVRYDMLCKDNIWHRTRQMANIFMSNDTRIDCSNCWGGNESDSDSHHCTR